MIINCLIPLRHYQGSKNVISEFFLAGDNYSPRKSEITYVTCILFIKLLSDLNANYHCKNFLLVNSSCSLQIQIVKSVSLQAIGIIKKNSLSKNAVILDRIIDKSFHVYKLIILHVAQYLRMLMTQNLKLWLFFISTLA